MSTLGDAVLEVLERRKKAIAKDRVDTILTDAAVSSTASAGVPAQLRVRRVHVSGTREFQQGEGKDATDVTAPIDLNWTPLDGVNGVGSEQNLRGKSSVVHFATWALTGRSHLQAGVESWIDHVSAELLVDGVPLFVEFDVVDGVPTGSIEVESGGRRTQIGNFSDGNQFESLMGSVMLGRLRLDPIPTFSRDGISHTHTWPMYASSLTVRADQLDPILGPDVHLKTKILQMFVGTSWASMDAQITRALNALLFERGEQEQQVRTTSTRVPSSALGDAEDRVARAREALTLFDPDEPDVDAVYDLASRASERAREARVLELQLMTAGAAFTQARSQLRAEQHRKRAVEETAVAQALFNGMKPTACPRCASTVTQEAYEAEVTDHNCSLCHNTLHLNAAIVGNAPTPHEHEGAGDDLDDEVEDTQDPLDALAEAATEAQAAVSKLRDAYQAAESARVSAEAEANTARAGLDRARARTAATQELIAAQATLDALEGLERQVDAEGPDEPKAETSDRDERILVLDTASEVVKGWVKRDQDPMLMKVSEAIADLARRFGISNLESVSIKGNGNMDIVKGGVKATYSALTHGEKLRIKLSTAIALIQVGHRDNVGRHPGLLFVDSPAAEEIPESVLRTMLEAMIEVAEETELQIVVATTHAAMLSAVLDADHLLVATGEDYVW
jgi:hypothetical protein